MEENKIVRMPQNEQQNQAPMEQNAPSELEIRARNEMAMLEKSFHDNLFIAQNEISTSQTEIIKLRKMIERMKLDHMKLL